MDLPSNSHNHTQPKQPETHEVAKVIQGTAKVRKPTLGRRFHEAFFGGDIKGSINVAVNDVLIPSARDTFLDLVNQGLEQLLVGEVRSRPRSRIAGQVTRGAVGRFAYDQVSKGGLSQQRASDPRPILSRESRIQHNFEDIVLDSRLEAERVIDGLFYQIQKYGIVTVSNLYTLVGETPHHTDLKWGWDDIRGVAPVRVRDGFTISLPKPEPIE